MDGALARALKYAPERRAQGALCREKDTEKKLKEKEKLTEKEREREKEREQGERPCAMDGAL